ncbi:hypothetical protein Tco_0863291 [Tanacetum coccineum]
MDLFNLINAPNPLKVKTGARPRLSHEVPLQTATATRVIHMENTPATSISSETPPVIVKSPLDFSNEESLQLLTEGDETETQVPAAVAPEVPRAENPATMEVVPELNLEKEAAAMGPPLNKRRRKRDKGEAEANAPPKKAAAAEDPDSKKSISFTSMGGPPEDIYQPRGDAKIMVDHILLQGTCQLLTPLAQMMIPRPNIMVKPGTAEWQWRDQSCRLRNWIKAAFEEFKKYEDDRVTSRCAEIDARLDALSIDFDEELYPHMLTAIAGRRWVIGHSLRLAVMKCAKSIELRQVFANVVSAGIAKGMSEGLKHGVEHGKAKLDLAAVEAYDPEADDKFTTALQAIKDLDDTGVDAPQFIRDLRPSSSQLKIPVYPEKKKSRVVCRTHGVGSAHHARSDGVPVSVPTVAPQGLKILLVDAATQTKVSEDEGSPRLLRSKSLPPMFNLEW